MVGAVVIGAVAQSRRLAAGSKSLRKCPPPRGVLAVPHAIFDPITG